MPFTISSAYSTTVEVFVDFHDDVPIIADPAPSFSLCGMNFTFFLEPDRRDFPKLFVRVNDESLARIGPGWSISLEHKWIYDKECDKKGPQEITTVRTFSAAQLSNRYAVIWSKPTLLIFRIRVVSADVLVWGKKSVYRAFRALLRGGFSGFWAYMTSDAPISQPYNVLHPLILRRFVDETTAREFHYNCILRLEDDEERKVYVNKVILSLYSTFFGKLFAGDVFEASKNEIALKDLKFEEFIEYVMAVYPNPRPLELERVPVLLKLAKRFGNGSLLHTCESFMVSLREAEEKAKTLEICDTFGLDECFKQIVEKLSAGDLKVVSLEKAKTFKEENMLVLLGHSLGK